MTVSFATVIVDFFDKFRSKFIIFLSSKSPVLFWENIFPVLHENVGFLWVEEIETASERSWRMSWGRRLECVLCQTSCVRSDCVVSSFWSFLFFPPAPLFDRVVAEFAIGVVFYVWQQVYVVSVFIWLFWSSFFFCFLAREDPWYVILWGWWARRNPFELSLIGLVVDRVCLLSIFDWALGLLAHFGAGFLACRPRVRITQKDRLELECKNVFFFWDSNISS